MTPGDQVARITRVTYWRPGDRVVDKLGRTGRITRVTPAAGAADGVQAIAWEVDGSRTTVVSIGGELLAPR